MATDTAKKSVFPLLPLRGLFLYPGMVLHFDVGRDKSIRALEQAMVEEHLILLTSQDDVRIDDPTDAQLYRVGTVARVKQMMKLPNGIFRVLVEGMDRARIEQFVRTRDWFEVRVQRIPDPLSATVSAELQALSRSVIAQFEQYVKLSKKVDQETYTSVLDIEHPGRLADAIASHLPLKIRDKQDILEAFDIDLRMQKLVQILSDEREVLELERKIHQRVRKQMERTQKEYYLREQMKAIQNELGERDGRAAEIEELRIKMAGLALPEMVAEKVNRELERLERIPASSVEGAVIRTYIDWLLALPWLESSAGKIDLKRAERVLNHDHYGMDTVKERILEFLAVAQLASKQTGPIICLAGPPGVGKTSLATSIAKSLQRPLVRMSLGGVRDEAEIRGHRRTYVGAMPGKIVQSMKSAGKINPIFLLDEVDKMANDFRGDPASAMLEVLDPEQNNTFADHYLEIPYDLSHVLFITTANNVYDIPGPLRDRMEVIHLSGYTEVEKLQIAKRHLLPKQRAAHALRGEHVRISDATLLELIRGYTREAGVRQLDRLLASVCRKVARKVASGEVQRVKVSSEWINEVVGQPIFHYGKMEERDLVGVVTGLSWTEAGGDTLMIEVSVVPGKGALVLTGQLGDVMKESAQTALSYIRSRTADLSLPVDFAQRVDIHVHVPEGAIPKDGPSAGITMATAIVSALTNRPVSRVLAMTGEITLRGRVLPIGGLKEKSLAAHRTGMETVIIPEGNMRDLRDVPDSVREKLNYVPVSHMDEVLSFSLLPANESDQTLFADQGIYSQMTGERYIESAHQ